MDLSSYDYWCLLQTGSIRKQADFNGFEGWSYIDSLYTMITSSPMVVGIVIPKNMNITLEYMVATLEVEIANHFAGSVQRFIATM